MRKKRGTGGGKRPAKDGRGEKGKSAALKESPRELPRFGEALTATLRETVRVCADGKEQEMTKLEAITHQMVGKAMLGDARMMRHLIPEMRRARANAGRDDSARPLAPVDREVLEALFARIRDAATLP